MKRSSQTRSLIIDGNLLRSLIHTTCPAEGKLPGNQPVSALCFDFIPMSLVLALLVPVASLAAGPSIDHAIQLHTAGRLKEALGEYHAVVAAVGASDPAVVGTALNNACVIQMNLGEYRAALPDCREALRLSRAGGHPEALAQALNNLGWVLQGLGETAEAEREYREALEFNRRRGDAEGEAINLSNLGALAIATGRYSAA